MYSRIRIKLKSYDAHLLDRSVNKIVKAAKTTQSMIRGPIPLPTRKEKFTLLRSPHVFKKSRDQFQIATHARLMDIDTDNAKTVAALMKLSMPSGVDVSIKVLPVKG